MGNSAKKEEKKGEDVQLTADEKGLEHKGDKKDGKKDEKEDKKIQASNAEQLEALLRKHCSANAFFRKAVVDGEVAAVRTMLTENNAKQRDSKEAGGKIEMNASDLTDIQTLGKNGLLEKNETNDTLLLWCTNQATGDTAFHLAAQTGNVDMVDLLTNSGVNVNEANKHGTTALHRAVGMKQRAVVDYLINKAGVNLHAKNKIGNTALHVAAYTGAVEIAELLMNKGAHSQVTWPNHVGMTPLDYAVKKQMFQYLDCKSDQHDCKTLQLRV